jgi:hypothetical protein
MCESSRPLTRDGKSLHYYWGCNMLVQMDLSKSESCEFVTKEGEVINFKKYACQLLDADGKLLVDLGMKSGGDLKKVASLLGQ